MLGKMWDLVVLLIVLGVVFGAGYLYGSYRSYKTHRSETITTAKFNCTSESAEVFEKPKHRTIDL